MSKTCRINSHEIRSEEDLEKVIAEMDARSLAEWGRPLLPTAISFMYERFRSCFQQNSRKETVSERAKREARETVKRILRQAPKRRESEFKPTFEEMFSGKRADQIKKDRKEALKSEQQRRERERKRLEIIEA